MSPWLVLGLTFVLSAGAAVEAPSWRAVLPELVAPEDLPAANALNGIEFNVARAVGPALAGLLIAAAGVGAAFVLNALSFFAVIVVITRWKRSVRRSTAPTETLGGATVAAPRYVRHSPDIRTLLVRTSGVMFFGTAVMALMPIVAARVSANSLGYGVLLGCFGAGAVLSALLLPWARARLSLEGILSGALAVLSVALIAAGTLHSLVALGPFMLVGGAAWMTFISLLTTTVQQLAPAWVRARVGAVFLLAFEGSLALGSLVWGLVAEHDGVSVALLTAGVGTAAAMLLRFVAPMPSVDVDLTTCGFVGASPRGIADLGYDVNDGPVLVSIE